MPDEMCKSAWYDARFIGHYLQSPLADNLASSVRWCMVHGEFEHASIESELLYITWMADTKNRDYRFLRRK
jgi:hypothetical protein